MVMRDIKSNRCALKSLLVSAEDRKEFTYIIVHIANTELEKLIVRGNGIYLTPLFSRNDTIYCLITEISKKALKQYMDCCHHHH